jgi:hypothetical protein
LAFFDVFGLYVVQRYVKKDDALRLWAEPVYLAWHSAQPFLDFRARQVGHRAGPYLNGWPMTRRRSCADVGLRW